MSGTLILPLTCPRCGTELTGPEQSLMFACTDCRRHYQAGAGAWAECAIQVAAVDDREPRGLVLPVWAFRVRVAATWADPRQKAEASLVPPIPRVYVTAFSLRNASYFGDLGVVLTERRLELHPAPWRPVYGCVRGEAEARQFVEPHVLGIIDRRVDVTGATLSCTIAEGQLWGIPCADRGDAIEDGLIGLRWPAAALDDLAAIRTAAAGR